MGCQLGAKRLLNGAISEELLAIDNQNHNMRHQIHDGPAALSKSNVSNYIGEVHLFPVTDTGQTMVLWTSSWEKSGGGVKAFCDPIYQALLGDLKASLAS